MKKKKKPYKLNKKKKKTLVRKMPYQYQHSIVRHSWKQRFHRCFSCYHSSSNFHQQRIFGPYLMFSGVIRRSQIKETAATGNIRLLTEALQGRCKPASLKWSGEGHWRHVSLNCRWQDLRPVEFFAQRGGKKLRLIILWIHFTTIIIITIWQLLTNHFFLI